MTKLKVIFCFISPYMQHIHVYTIKYIHVYNKKFIAIYVQLYIFNVDIRYTAVYNIIMDNWKENITISNMDGCTFRYIFYI